jgi:sugar lactone lactonase YvrE
MQPRPAIDTGDDLGEGPHWDERAGALLWVDIKRGRIHTWTPGSDSGRTETLDAEVSAVIPRADAPGHVVAAGHRVLLRDGERERVLATVEENLPDNRFNDCKCDPQGRLWAGTMSKIREPTGVLYRLEPGGEIERIIAGTTISNGLGWSPSGETMYFIDSPTQRIDAFDFDGATGAIANRRALVEIDPDDGLPDGMTVDSEGGIWLCLFGGAAIRRYAPDGRLEASISLPTTNPTSVAFGGPDLRTLYITTARHLLTRDQVAAEPLAGAVLTLEPGVSGLRGNRFAG